MRLTVPAAVLVLSALSAACSGDAEVEPTAAVDADETTDSSDAASVLPDSDSSSAEDAATDGADTATATDSGGVDAPVDSGDPGTAGCGKTTSVGTGTWVTQTLMVGSATREYYVWLPAGYDRNRRYPIVYLFHGCSSSTARQTNVPPVQNHSGGNAILIRGKAAADCWNSSPTSVDMAYFDALVPAVENAFCANSTRRFAGGYSSGAFFTHRLACIRGAMFRAVATIAGGMSGTSCTGNVGALLIHDVGDSTVNISESVKARDNHITRNTCDAMATRTAFAPSPCEQYAGCDAGKPVVWCQTTGKNHDRQDTLASQAFWNFYASLIP